MGERVKLWVRTMLVAGLFWGSAAPAQEIVQANEVSYALSLIDAGADGTATSKTGGVVTDATQKVRVKMTVSVPRSATTHSGVTVNTQPARLMFRKHKGPATAFDGSIVLVRDAPYGTNGLPYAAGYYPMPQAGDAGQEKTDPTQLNYTAVVARSTTNLAGTAWSSYVLAPAQEYSPARWECTYLSAAAYDISDMTTLERDYPMIASLLNGQGSYEWYAASRYGLGSVARISDIQDLGRDRKSVV